MSPIMPIIIFISWVVFFYGGYFEGKRNRNTKEGTPSASHNSAMLEIASVVKELAIDIEDDGTVQAEYYCQRLNAVVAQLQQ